MSAVKNEVSELLKRLPNDYTLEDVQYHLYVLEKARRSEERADKEGTLPQSEIEKRFDK